MVDSTIIDRIWSTIVGGVLGAGGAALWFMYSVRLEIQAIKHNHDSFKDFTNKEIAFLYETIEKVQAEIKAQYGTILDRLDKR